jgi:TRAP-type C4-dicarboxylate transport system permease small subunit
MRDALDKLYRASGWTAAGFLVAIFLVVLGQVILNLTNTVVRWTTGQASGFLIPSYAEFAGYFLAAASFLALAYTLKNGAHIRVTLVIQHLPPGVRRVLEVWCAAVGAALSGYFTYWAANLTWQSWKFGDVSYGLVAIPLWLPQAALVLGAAVLTVALVDELQRVARGLPPAYDTDAGILSGSDSGE